MKRKRMGMSKGAGHKAANKARPASEPMERDKRMKVRTKRIAKAKAALGDEQF